MAATPGIPVRHPSSQIVKNFKETPYSDEYEVDFCSQFGIGVSGAVRPVIHRSSGKRYAVKFLRDGHEARQEVCSQLMCLPCDGIISIVDVYANSMKLFGDAIVRKWLVVVMEAMEGGELFYRIKQRKRLSEPECKSVVQQIAAVLQHMHKIGVVHRDIKPENILLKSKDSLELKLGDFGFATSETPISGRFTPNYVAPEILLSCTQRRLLGRGIPYTSACDLWSLGVVLYISLSGYTPFYSTSGQGVRDVIPLDMRDQILNGRFDMPDREWGPISNMAKDMVRRLLLVNPCERMSATECLLHPWIKAESPSPLLCVVTAAQATAIAATNTSGSTAAVTSAPMIQQRVKCSSPGSSSSHVPATVGEAEQVTLNIIIQRPSVRRSEDLTTLPLPVPAGSLVKDIMKLINRAEPALQIAEQRLVARGIVWCPDACLRDYLPVHTVTVSSMASVAQHTAASSPPLPLPKHEAQPHGLQPLHPIGPRVRGTLLLPLMCSNSLLLRRRAHLPARTGISSGH